jgi:hypothetical protein
MLKNDEWIGVGHPIAVSGSVVQKIDDSMLRVLSEFQR